MKGIYKVAWIACGLAFALAYVHKVAEPSGKPSGSVDSVIDNRALALPALEGTSPTAIPRRSTQLSSHEQNISEDVRERARSVRNCVRYLDSSRRAAELLQISTRGFNANQMSFYDKELKEVNGALAELSLRRACVGLDPSNVREQEYSALKDAALAGDWDAASCYTIASFDAPDELMTADAVSAYRNSARTFIAEGMRRGDWRFVSLAELSVGDLVARHPSQFNHNLFHRLITPDKKKGYGYARLERLGATGDYANKLDTQLDAMAAHLSEDDVEEMNRWAAEEYRIHFSDKPKIQESPTLCDLR